MGASDSPARLDVTTVRVTAAGDQSNSLTGMEMTDSGDVVTSEAELVVVGSGMLGKRAGSGGPPTHRQQ